MAFFLQTVAVSVAHIDAAFGLLPEPAVELAGSVHYHGSLSGHVHAHDGDSDAGHVHGLTDEDRGLNSAPSLALFSVVVNIPVLAILEQYALVGSLLDLPESATAEGRRPPNLARPPSTPSIA